METTSNHYILILCGGSGPRLWPLSRASRPKQFLSIVNQNSLIQNTFDRFAKFVPAKNIFFVSHQKYISQLQKIFKTNIPAKNYIAEPEKRNTAAAILLGVSVINKINPNAIVTATPSDHFIEPDSVFKQDIKLAATIAATTQNIVTIGIKPTFANPGFGYILPLSKTKTFYPVSEFIEKPSVIDANLLIKKDALWNSGIYTFSLKTILHEFSSHAPKYFQQFAKLSQNLPSTYKLFPKLPIDKVISEKSKSLVMIKARFNWSDVGEWYSIWQILTKDKQGIATINKTTTYTQINSKNCLLSADPKKLIGLVGLNNLAIIDTPDSLLVCNLNDSYAVRDLVKNIVNSPKLKYYFLSKNDK